MAKIKVTESELKQLIRESVESILKEANWNNYGMDWDQLSEPEKKAYAQRYANRANATYYTDANGNRISGGYATPNTNYDYDKLGQFYKTQQTKKAGKSHRNGFSAEYVKNLQNNLNQAQSQNKAYTNALNQIKSSLKLQEQVNEDTHAPEGNTNTGTDTQATAIPDLQPILAKIKELNDSITKQQGIIAQYKKANATQKQQLASLQQRVTNQANNVPGVKNPTAPVLAQQNATAQQPGNQIKA